MSDGLTRAALQFAAEAGRLDEAEVMDGLHAVARHAEINAMLAYHVPPSVRLGERKPPYPLHAHSSLPVEFVGEFWRLFEQHGPSFVARIAWDNHDAFTLSEALRHRRPSGNERWFVELLRKHKIRDLFYVPNGTWMVAFWSRKALTADFDRATRVPLEFAAHAAARRLQELTGKGSWRKKRRADPLSDRQREVLGLLARGYSPEKAAAHLGITEKTLYTHRKRAIKNLGARAGDIAHAITLALARYGVLGMAALLAAAALPDWWLSACPHFLHWGPDA